MSRRRVLWVSVLGLGLALLFAAQAFAATTVISQPNAAYLAATKKIDFSAIVDGVTVANVTDGVNQVFFDQVLTKATVPGTWNNWSSPPFAESHTPAVLYEDGSTSLNMQLGQPVKEFGFEMEPDSPPETDTVTFKIWMGGTPVQTITKSISGFSGGRLCAVLSDVQFSRVEIVSSTSGGIGIAQLRYALPTALAKPSVSPSKPAHGKTAQFTSYLSPTAATAGGSTSLALFRKETKTVTKKVNGKNRKVKVKYWHLRKTLSMTAGSGGKLTGSGSLPYSGTWEAIANYSGSAGYVATTSAAKVFTVK